MDNDETYALEGIREHVHKASIETNDESMKKRLEEIYENIDEILDGRPRNCNLTTLNNETIK